MTEEEKEKEGESGVHEDNDLTDVQKIMKDNDLPVYKTSKNDDGSKDKD